MPQVSLGRNLADEDSAVGSLTICPAPILQKRFDFADRLIHFIE